jgi:hypothetical protein
VIFRRGKKRRDEPEAEDGLEEGVSATEPDEADADEIESETSEDETAEAADVDDLTALDELEWRESGPWDISEVEDLEGTDDQPRIDLGSIILTGVPGSELRLQVAEETNEIVSAMMIIETAVEPSGDTKPGATAYSSALELGAYAAPRSGGLWAELREDIIESATAEGGSASLIEGPFGVELRRLVPVTTPGGEQGYQPSRMWVAEGPRWLLRGIVYGQAAVEDDPDSPVVRDVLAAFRQVVVRRGDEAMAPGDLLPLRMPTTTAAG